MPNYLIIAYGGIISDLEGYEVENNQVLDEVEADNPYEAFDTWYKHAVENEMPMNYSDVKVIKTVGEVTHIDFEGG